MFDLFREKVTLQFYFCFHYYHVEGRPSFGEILLRDKRSRNNRYTKRNLTYTAMDAVLGESMAKQKNDSYSLDVSTAI